MAAVNDYLKKLLYQYDCVVVPELGAFLTHYQTASFTAASSSYLPPRKRVAFNEALRLDDGILANYIMLHEPVTRDGAQRHISTFVSELRQQVATTGRFELEGIGTFTVNEEGKLQFDPSLRHNFFGEAYGLSALSVQSVQQQPEPALEAIPVTALGPVPTHDDETTLLPYRPNRSYWRVAAIALLVGSLGTISYFSVINPGQPFQSSLDPAGLLRATASLVDRSAKPTEATPRVEVPKPTPVPMVEATPAPEPSAPVVTNKTEPAPIAETAPVADRTMPSPTANRELKAVPASAAVKVVRTSPHYTVIAGVFSSKRNALNLKRRLRKAGYDDAFVIMPSTGQKELYKVAAAGSAIRDEAVSKMAAIDSLAGTNSWIFKN